MRDRVDAALGRSYHPAMPMWRCPHCGTPQQEAARCWVCRKSSTTCSTCRRFRSAVAGGLGYCGLDRRRVPLTGLELRGCWEAAASGGAGAPTDTDRPLVAVGPGRQGSRGFVPIDEVETVVAAEPVVGRATPRDDALALTLFGEPDR